MEIDIVQRNFPPFFVVRKFCIIELPLSEELIRYKQIGKYDFIIM